jgi:SAM-dependent methyltransferase
MKLCSACDASFDDPDWRCHYCGWAADSLDEFPALAPALAREGEGFRPEYFAALATLEAGNFWFQSRNALIVRALRRHVPNLQSFLEIGCGTGFVLSGIASAFPEAALAGSEIFSAGLPYAAKRVPKAEFMQMDARRIPFKSHFDAVGVFDVLEHIAEDEKVLAQIYRAIKPGGAIVLTVPQHPWLWSRQDEMACHVRRYTAGELRRKVEQAGFTIIQETSFVSLLLPIMWLSRRFGRRAQDQDFDTLAELKIGEFANRLLRTVMDVERFALDCGMRFPAGGSRLLIARKV